MVTPYNASASSIVPLRWVITMNWVNSVDAAKYFPKRDTFASSKAASTSSKIQNGTGLTSMMANKSASAVKAFSPP